MVFKLGGMEQTVLFYRLGVALFIGFLVGLQREHALGQPDRELATGVRTFTLMALLGAAAALLGERLGSPWPFVGVLALVGTLLAISYFVHASQGDVGLTTEIAALLTLVAGALSYLGHVGLAVALGVATTALLALKLEMQTMAQRLSREDLFATLKFAVITAIVLPLLPDAAWQPPPLDVLNPYRVWLMVVLISGIGFLGYGLMKLLGPRAGIALTGILGGLVSSTAVTLSLSQRSRTATGLVTPLALAIVLSWVVMLLRILLIVGVLDRRLLLELWPPLAAGALAGLACSGYFYLRGRRDESAEVAFENPFELGPALKFGLLYALILVLSRSAQTYLGDAGVYLSSAAAGLADLNAITLSLTELTSSGRDLSPTVAARALVLAAVINTAVKGALLFGTASASLRRTVLWALGLMLAATLAASTLLT